MGLFDKFRIGLGKSSDGLSSGFKNIFSKKIDENVLAEFEELIISSDAGVDVAKELRKDFENIKIDKKLDNHKEILKLIADKMAVQLLKYEKDLSLMGNAKLLQLSFQVLMVLARLQVLVNLESTLKTIIDQLYLVQRILLEQQQ